MQKMTKEIIDEIISQWGDGKLFVTAGHNKDYQEVYTVAKNSNKNTGFKRRAGDRLKKGEDISQEDIICTIIVQPSREKSEAYIYFRGSYSIDNSHKSVYRYLKKFLAVIKSKVRQTNALAVQAKLGIISRSEFDIAINSFEQNKEVIVSQTFSEEMLKENTIQ